MCIRDRFNGGKFEGWGTSFCWWPNRIGYLDELSEQAAKLFFDPKEGLGLNIIRYNIGGGDDPTHHHITRTDSMVPGYAINPSHDANGYHWSYDWNADQNQDVYKRQANGLQILQEILSDHDHQKEATLFTTAQPPF